MLDGVDWTEDRAWERAALLGMEPRAARNLIDLRYPHFRTDRIVEIIEADEAPTPKVRTLANG